MSFPIFTLLNINNSSFLNKNEFKILSIGSESINNCDYITIGFITLIFKGYIYNFNELIDIIQNTSLEIEKNNKDYEIIIHLYNKYGIQYTLSLLQGSFAFILFDNNYYKDGSKMYVARDPFGIEPLYIYNTIDGPSSEHVINEMSFYYEPTTTVQPTIFAFSSNLRQLSEFSKLLNKQNCIKQFPPGHYNEYSFSYKVLSYWKEDNFIKYYNFPTTQIIPKSVTVNDIKVNTNHTLYNICNNLIDVIKKQVNSKSCRHIGCLLSGGLDSSIISAILNEYCIGNSIQLETFSIGFLGSDDLKYAKIVSEYLRTKHTEIIITEKEYFRATEQTIKILGTYDTITVRSGIPNYLINEWIIKNSNIQLLFTGDGADELMGGHLYLHMAKNEIDFDNNCKELLNNIHHFDVLRSSKCATSSIQICMPFLDPIFVQNYLSIPLNFRYRYENKYNEKFLLRMAFSKENSLNMYSKPWLPDEILYRTKEEFSDGLSPPNKKTAKIITDFTNTLNLDIKQCKKYAHNRPNTIEKLFYREIFEKYYPNLGNILPFMWMPQFIDTSEPSPRSSGIYNEYIFWKNNNI